MLKRISVESILVMFLFIMFSASIGILIVEGQESYEAIIKSKNENEDRRIAYSYISKKLKQNNIAGNIEVVTNPYNDYNAIKFKLIGEEEGYYTYIFYADNALIELLTFEGESIDKELGEKIINLSTPIQFEFDSDYNLINIYNGDETISVGILDREAAYEEE